MTQLRIRDETHWITCTSVRHLLLYLFGKTSDRKLRLWACASASRRCDADEKLREIIALVGSWADGTGTPDWGWHHDNYLCCATAFAAAYGGEVRHLERQPDSAAKRAAERFQLATLRDVFGNPFRPVTVDPNWLTADVLTLARGIYDDKAFDRMPILADALQDAGCANDEVLSHCRSGGPHVRGCWVCDLVLGKA